MSARHDMIVIGAGMAGTAIAAHLSEHASVRLLEMEHHPGFHSTGRSAAVFFEAYGNAQIRALTRASRSFLFSPPSGFSQTLMRPRSLLMIARHGQEAAMHAFLKSSVPSDGIVELSAEEALNLLPVLRRDSLVGALYTKNGADIDVNELHQGYRRLLHCRGGALSINSEVIALNRTGEEWSVVTKERTYTAKTIVNATGAWANFIAEMAGATNIQLQPLKRTACLIPAPEETDVDRWPMLVDVEEQFYLKPEAGALLLSPADETPSHPCDVQADDIDVAIAVDRIERATTLSIQRVSHRWAGLRSFAPDRSPVVGFDPIAPGFFWYAALGGYGIQTAPALSAIAAALATGSAVDNAITQSGVSIDALSPNRFAGGGE